MCWIIEGNYQQGVILFEFKQFDLEPLNPSCYDFLEIRDGMTKLSQRKDFPSWAVHALF